MKWSQVPLSRVQTQIIRGVTFSQDDSSVVQTSDSIAVLRAGNIQDRLITDENLVWIPSKIVSMDQYLRLNDIVVCTSSGSTALVGKSAILDHEFVGTWGAFNAVIRCDPQFLLPQFMSYWLRSSAFDNWKKRHVQGANIQNIRISEFESLQVPLPPLPEQQRIVEILKQIKTLHCQRQELLNINKKLPAILFLEMFGDPRSQSKKWKKLSLSKLVTVRSSLKIPTPDKYGAMPCIGPDSIESSTGQIINLPTVADVLPRSGKYLFEAGDVLYSKIRPNLAKVVLADRSGFCSADIYPLVVCNKIRPIYLQYLLLTDGFTQFALSHSDRAQMPKLNREQLLSYQAILPPLDLQIKYENIVGELRKLYGELLSSNTEMENLVVLMNGKAFSGKLTQFWRVAHRQEMETWLRESGQPIPRKATRVSIEIKAPPERAVPARSARRWLIDQLSELQDQVYKALKEWKGSLIPSEDLDQFMNSWPIEHLEGAHDHVKRVLNQLAGMGFISCISVPNVEGEYVTAYRVLREDELTHFEDRERLERPA